MAANALRLSCLSKGWGDLAAWGPRRLGGVEVRGTVGRPGRSGVGLGCSTLLALVGTVVLVVVDSATSSCFSGTSLSLGSWLGGGRSSRSTAPEFRRGDGAERGGTSPGRASERRLVGVATRDAGAAVLGLGAGAAVRATGAFTTGLAPRDVGTVEILPPRIALPERPPAVVDVVADTWVAAAALVSAAVFAYCLERSINETRPEDDGAAAAALGWRTYDLVAAAGAAVVEVVETALEEPFHPPLPRADAEVVEVARRDVVVVVRGATPPDT